jgi:hypothetical protein
LDSVVVPALLSIVVAGNHVPHSQGSCRNEQRNEYGSPKALFPPA